jgi:hypothetical protein
VLCKTASIVGVKLWLWFGGERNSRFLICDNIDFGDSRAVIEPGFALVWTEKK